MLDRVVLRVSSNRHDWVEVDDWVVVDGLDRLVRIYLGRVEHGYIGDSEYVIGLRPCYAVFVKYDCSSASLPCEGELDGCPCDVSLYPNPPYLGTECDYTVRASLDFVAGEGWIQWRSTGCFNAPSSDDCRNHFSELNGVGGVVDIEVPNDIWYSSDCWAIVVCVEEVEYRFQGVFTTAIFVEPPSEGCEVSYEFIKSETGGVGLHGTTDSEVYLSPYAGSYYSQLRLTLTPGPGYEIDTVQYKWIYGSGGEGTVPGSGNQYTLTLPSSINRTDVLYVWAKFRPVSVELKPGFPILQGMHLFGGWNLGYLEVINSNVEFHFGVSGFSNLPIGLNDGGRKQEILTPILVRQKCSLPGFGSIARLENSNLTFYIPHPLKFKEVYSNGIYGTRFTNPQRVIDTDHRLTDDSLISIINTSYGKYLMSMVTFVADNSTDSSASRSIEFYGCSIRVVHNLYLTNNSEWPHVSYFTFIRKFIGTADSTFSSLDYIILPCMFRDNTLSGFFYEDDVLSGNSALFAAFTGFQFILDSIGKAFFFDLPGSENGNVNADTLEDSYFVPRNKTLNAFVNITQT